MFQLIFSEIKYNRFFLFMSVAHLILLYYLAHILLRIGTNLFPYIPIVAVGIIYFNLAERMTKDKVSYYRALPFSATEVGIARLLFQLPYLILAMASFYIFDAMVMKYAIPQNALWRLASLSSILIAGNVAWYISYDLKAGAIDRASRMKNSILVVITWMIVFLSGISHWEGRELKITGVEPLTDLMVMVYHSFYGIILLQLVAVGLSFTSVMIYKKRMKYVS